MVDDPIVEQDAVSEPIEGEALQVEEVKETPPLTMEAVQKLVADGIAEATAKAIEVGKGQGRSEMQSVKDKEVAKANRETRYAQDTLAQIKGRYAKDDPEAYRNIVQDERNIRLSHYDQQENEKINREQAEVTIRDFEETMTDLIQGIGLDPKDARINWGDKNSMNLTQRQKQIVESTKAAFKEDSTARDERLTKELEERITREKRKESGVDEHDTTPSGGGGSQVIPTDMGQFKTWVADLPSDKYAQLRPKIEKMLAEGKIK